MNVIEGSIISLQNEFKKNKESVSYFENQRGN